MSAPHKESVKIGKVKNWLVKAASKVGLDITGYEHSIDVSAVKHIVKKHGNISVEDQRGNIAITDNDIQLIPSIVAGPDYVVFGTETRAHKDGITYIKRMDDGTTFYVEEVRSGQKTLSAQTLYKKRSVQLTADSIRASAVLRPKRLTDHIEIIANPDKDVKTLFQFSHNPRGYPHVPKCTLRYCGAVLFGLFFLQKSTFFSCIILPNMS